MQTDNRIEVTLCSIVIKKFKIKFKVQPTEYIISSSLEQLLPQNSQNRIRNCTFIVRWLKFPMFDDFLISISNPIRWYQDLP
jgi:hypothetical protein